MSPFDTELMFLMGDGDLVRESFFRILTYQNIFRGDAEDDTEGRA